MKRIKSKQKICVELADLIQEEIDYTIAQEYDWRSFGVETEDGYTAEVAYDLGEIKIYGVYDTEGFRSLDVEEMLQESFN